MLFILNKYTQTYYRITDRARRRALPKEMYTEKHHIIPDSLGGDSSKENIAVLTAREHFICHWLLTKMLTGQAKSKMVYALSMMRCSSYHTRYDTKITARVYENLKGKRIVSDVTRARMRIASKGRTRKHVMSAEERTARGNARRGATHTEETKQKIGDAHRGKVLSEETKAKIRVARAKQVCSDETKKKMAASHAGKKWYNNGKKAICVMLGEQPAGYVLGRKLLAVSIG